MKQMQFFFFVVLLKSGFIKDLGCVAGCRRNRGFFSMRSEERGKKGIKNLEIKGNRSNL